MSRFAVLFLVAAAGCNPSTAPYADTGPKESPNNPPPPAEKRPEHDYQGWKQYAPTEPGFEVWFPSEPLVRAASQATGNLHVAGVQRRGPDDLAFTCQWKIRDQPFASPEAELAYLMGQQLGALKSTKGRLLVEQEITLDGSRGREFIIAIDDTNVNRIRSYLAGKRMVSLQVLGKDKEAVHSTDATKFLDSLKFRK
jgi:hypothetical protein